MLTILWAIVAFIIAISLLIAFHEFGHFIVARALGVKVIRFSIGFGKAIWSRTSSKGTQYRIAVLPFGGYVKMVDEREGEVQEADLPYAFNRQPVWSRMLIVLAGPFFNFIFAVFAYWLMFVIGTQAIAPVVGPVLPNTPIATIGLQRGDEIIAVNKTKTPNLQALNLALIKHIGDDEPVDLQVKERQGNKIKSFSLDLSQLNLSGKHPNLFKSIGFNPYFPSRPAIIAKVANNSVAAKAGIKAGDKILKVAGVKVNNWIELAKAISQFPNKSIALEIKRGDELLNIHLTPKAIKGPDGKTYARLGIQSKMLEIPADLLRTDKYGPMAAILPALTKTGSMSVLTLTMLYKMIVGDISVRAISGPVGIAQGAGMSAQMGFSYYLAFLALVSISLGIINLLPIPILDGGHFLYFVIEAIRGKPLSEKAQEFGLRLGLMLLLALMIFAISNDISRFF